MMKDTGSSIIKTSPYREILPLDIDFAAAMIVKAQKETGEIPWSKGFKTDPWDHVEAAMGLCIGG